MKKIFFYYLGLLIILSLLFFLISNQTILLSFKNSYLPISCILMGGIGGILYCLRALYVHVSINKDWDSSFEPWYYLRPLASLICGGIAFLFIKSGLLILEASPKIDSSNLGILALSFIAGLNVNNFIKRIESLMKSSSGINESNLSKGESK